MKERWGEPERERERDYKDISLNLRSLLLDFVQKIIYPKAKVVLAVFLLAL